MHPNVRFGYRHRSLPTQALPKVAIKIFPEDMFVQRVYLLHLAAYLKQHNINIWVCPCLERLFEGGGTF